MNKNGKMVEIKRLKPRLIGIVHADGHTELFKTIREAIEVCNTKKYILKPYFQVVKE